ncbi:hypothetical protein GRI39_11485 [Altererythrobacter indicus]|uniref:Uncharacterized protein n=1 Tax=Altericroceibacterium indicum TaxID=374177 RepID=A0A845AHS1_9SPHN|nr:hypothetical protein [Altericroceibacterium indicum]MXP26658.1 hypothetical protein [Altericroceibacterium indicum]
MDRNGDEVHVSTDEARGGSTPNVMRWVLIISVVLAVVLLSASWMLPAATDDEDSQGLTSGAMMSQPNASTEAKAIESGEIPKSKAATETESVLFNDDTPKPDPLAEKKRDDDGLDVIEN